MVDGAEEGGSVRSRVLERFTEREGGKAGCGEGGEDRKDGDDGAAIAPWRRSIVAPTDTVVLSDPSPPPYTLHLRWMHGYDGSGSRNNLFYTVDGRVVYPVGRTLVAYDRRTDNSPHSQSFYRCSVGDEVTCVASHPHESVCAIGRTGVAPEIRRVDYGTMETRHVFRGYHYRAVLRMEFDPEGRYLVTVGMDDAHSVVVFDWEGRCAVASSQTSPRTTLDIGFEGDRRYGWDRWNLVGTVRRRTAAVLDDEGQRVDA